MNKILSLAITAVLSIAGASYLYAQPQIPAAPVDPGVRVGTLPNGMTYYIRHNEYPKGQVDFHIVQKVGSVQEEDNQRGLAHFLEHMCFNGTKNYPDKSMISWLESKGVKFGAHLNAYTATDQTVYKITNVPAVSSVVDSCLLILHDWASDLTLASDEINKERGVIHEEWRLGNAFERIFEANGATLYPGCKYGSRMPIGTMDVVDHFKPEVLRDYYHKWYRPDLQGLVVVGDINVDQVEAKIKEMFTPLKNPVNEAKFEYYAVPDNDSIIYVAQKDKEMPAAMFWVMLKFDYLPREVRNTDMELKFNYILAIIQSMMNERLDDISLKPNSPFGNSGASFDNYLISSTKANLMFQVMVNDKGNDAALKGILTEIKRVKDYGFTASEYDRARNEYMSRLEKAYTNRNKQENDTYAQEYIRNFLDNTPMAGIEYKYNTLKNFAPIVPLEAVNKAVISHIGQKNLVIAALGPDKADFTLPTIAEMKADVAAVEASTVEAPKDNSINEPLMKEMPKAGKIVSEKPAKFGFTELKLSNGAKVLLKPTDFKDDQILMYAVSEGGASLYPASDHANVSLIDEIWTLNGVDKFSYNDLQKITSGKQASISLAVSDYDESINGATTPKDLETMMQLLYLNLAKQRYNKQDFEAVKSMVASQLKNAALNPEYVFQDSLSNITYNHNPKAQIISIDLLNKIDYDRMSQIVKERFGNAAEFTFIIAGKFDMPTMRKYVEQYIASLPAKKAKKEVAVNDGLALRSGVYVSEFQHKTENNLAMLSMKWFAKIPYTTENRVKVSVAGQLMANELLNRVREDEGAAYSPYAHGSMEKTYDSKAIISTSFGMNPDKHDKSIALTIDCLESLSKEVKEVELNKAKEYMLKQITENEHRNGYWLGVAEQSEMNGIDVNTTYRSIVKSLTPKMMQDFIKSILAQGNRGEVIMMPEKK